MNRKELTKTFMMISNRKKHFGLQGFQKKIQRFKGEVGTVYIPGYNNDCCGRGSKIHHTLGDKLRYIMYKWLTAIYKVAM